MKVRTASPHIYRLLKAGRKNSRPGKEDYYTGRNDSEQAKKTCPAPQGLLLTSGDKGSAAKLVKKKGFLSVRRGHLYTGHRLSKVDGCFRSSEVPVAGWVRN